MGVRKKGRRKIICGNREYVWYICVGYDDNYQHLNIISQDKSFIVDYPISQIEINTEKHFIIAKGKRFQGAALNGRWNRFYTPAWTDNIITPQLVSDIIAWCEQKGSAEKATYGLDGVFA